MTEEKNNEEIKSEAPPTPGRVWGRIAKPLVGLAILVVVILWSVGVFRSRTSSERVEYQAGLAVPPNAKLFTVKQESIAPRVDVVGTVASGVKVNLSARIPAYVKEVFVSAGSPVKKGQQLITLDDREIKEQVTAAEAQFKQAETEFNRARQLFDNKATTEQALTAAQSMFTAARAQWDRSKIMLTYAQITSPMDGVVTDRRIEPGDMANPGQVLLAIYDPANMQLEVPVPARLLAKLPVGQAVEVTLDRPATNFQGRVRQIVSEIDPLSRTQLVKVHIEGPSSDVLPGTFGRLWVADDIRQTIVIPASAIYSVGQIELVQVVRDQRAMRRAVRSGPKHGASVEILSGLDAGDVVLVKPIQEN
ncbi:MAG: efflux RND transporter periplasmic adaptor subunit [Kiritimatiellae bacterium]|nr:efflux RND transporter periplasmic adaptor subunit [Kiritimatiellia bacterium]